MVTLHIFGLALVLKMKKLFIPALLAAISFNAAALTVTIDDAALKSSVKASVLAGKLFACQDIANKKGDYEKGAIFNIAKGKAQSVRGFDSGIYSSVYMKTVDTISISKCNNLIGASK